MTQLSQICRTSGVDVVALGPGDMALSMGIPGGWKDPRVLAAVDETLAAANPAGKPASIPALDPADGRALYAKGFQILLVSALSLTANAARAFVQEIGRG